MSEKAGPDLAVLSLGLKEVVGEDDQGQDGEEGATRKPSRRPQLPRTVDQARQMG